MAGEPKIGDDFANTIFITIKCFTYHSKNCWKPQRERVVHSVAAALLASKGLKRAGIIYLIGVYHLELVVASMRRPPVFTKDYSVIQSSIHNSAQFPCHISDNRVELKRCLFPRTTRRILNPHKNSEVKNLQSFLKFQTEIKTLQKLKQGKNLQYQTSAPKTRRTQDRRLLKFCPQ